MSGQSTVGSPRPTGPEAIPAPRAGGSDPEEALRRAMAGDQGAFVALYRLVQPRLRRYAWALVGQDADDVTAEAWLQISRDMASFSGDLDRFRGWTAGVVRHRALDVLRHRARRRSEPLGLHVAPQLADLTAAGDTAEVAIAALHTAQAVDLIASLPRDQAEAVLLRCVVGLSAQAAGDVLEKRPGAVRVNAHRGLRRLAAEIDRVRREGGGE